jgi:SAM-dependent methyltransferase
LRYDEAMAAAPEFDCDRLFDENYLYFYEEILTPERNEADAGTVWKLLALKPGQSVLELGCGHGRITNALAQKGARVTGVDRACAYLEKARTDAARLGADVSYVLGDMRETGWNQAFDAVFLWFNTYGYFSEEDNALVLERAVRALKPGGRLLIEQINRNTLLRDRLPLQFVIRRGDDLQIHLLDYDGLSDRSQTECIFVRDGAVRSVQYTVRLYSFSELSRTLKAYGMRSVAAFGEGGAPYSLYGNQLITVAVK